MEHFHSVGHNEVIGVCQVGNDAESLGRDHWNEMLSYPRKPIAHWHPLAEVRLISCFPITIMLNSSIRHQKLDKILQTKLRSTCILLNPRKGLRNTNISNKVCSFNYFPLL